MVVTLIQSVCTSQLLDIDRQMRHTSSEKSSSNFGVHQNDVAVEIKTLFIDAKFLQLKLADILSIVCFNINEKM